MNYLATARQLSGPDEPETIDCERCDGCGEVLVPNKLDDTDTCPDCDGRGWVYVKPSKGIGEDEYYATRDG